MADEHGKLSGKILGISAAAAVGGFLFGFDTAVINGAVDALSGTKAGFDLTPTLTGIAVSSALLGCTLGAMFAGRAADKFGRIKVMVVAAILFALSSVLSGFAFGVWDLILWRVVAGLGVGIASVVVPAYIAEVSPSSARGRLGSLQQLAIAFGIFGAFLSNLALASAAGTPEDPLWFGAAAWRWMLVAGVVPSIAYGVMALRLPESPRYLVTVGRVDEAQRILAENVGDPEPAETVREIRASLNHDHQPRFADLRSATGGLKPVVWVGILIALFQQTTGINIILYYGSTLWSLVGFSGGLSLAIPVGTSILGIVMTLVAIAVVDKAGRRPLLLIGSAGMAISLALVAVAFANGTPAADGSSHLPFGWAMTGLIAAHTFYIFFCATWGPVMWVMLGEIFPNQIRGAGMALATGVNWIANFLVAFTFPIFIAGIGLSTTYALYAILTALSFFFVLRRVPETKGRKLEDMTEDASPR
ncbi:sugar porter family MFS transporter [Micropruina sp.]|uniref:sugar porter family MFS transporter n=1 Tax=Micropruina sp. TaxID=2737536 RepID=UPI0039E60659